MSPTDRGAQRRRLLDAVREAEDSDSSTDAGFGRSDHQEPAPDGGTVILDGPLYHCTACGRTYLERPGTCRGCGARSFDRRIAD